MYYFQTRTALVVLLLCLTLCQDVLASPSRHRRGILGKWFGTDSNAVVQPAAIRRYDQQVQRVNQQVPHYPIWKVHKYNGINIKPMPVSMVPQYQPNTEVVRNVAAPVINVHQPVIVQEKVAAPALQTEPIVVAPITEQTTTEIANSKTEEDIKGIMKLLGISDPSQVPSIQEVMDMLGASTQEEAIDTVKEIAATEEGIDMIKSFIESRQTPEEDEDAIIEVITQPPTTTTTTTTTSTTTPPPPTTTTPAILPAKPLFHFWSPKNVLSSAGAKVASRLDRVHTNAHLLGKILPNTAATTTTEGSSTFRNTLRNLKNFFTFQDNSPVPIESLKVAPNQRQQVASPTVVYVNEPIPADPINLPALPQLATLPSLAGIRNIPTMPQIPQIQLPSHFNIPKHLVQGPYMKVKYPVSSLAPLPMYQQRHLRPLYTYRGQPIGNAPAAVKSSYEVPLYGQPQIRSSQIPFSQSTREAFQNAPQIISSLPSVPSLPYPFEEQSQDKPAQEAVDVDDQYFVAANSPIEAVVALPEDAVIIADTTSDNGQRSFGAAEIAKDEVVEEDGSAVAAAGPQRLSGYDEAYATGKVHRATNVDIVQSRLTNGDTSLAADTADEPAIEGGDAAE